MSEQRYKAIEVINALEYRSVFRGCCRVSIKNVLTGLSRDRVALFAGLLNRLYCNKDAKNVIHMLSEEDGKRKKLLRRLDFVEKQNAQRGVELVVAYDITPLEILRIAFSMDPNTMSDVPESDVDRIQFDLIKVVLQVNEDLMRFKIAEKDTVNMAKLIMVNSASYNDVLYHSEDPYLYQAAQSFLFFKWLETIPKYHALLKSFYDRFGIKTWQEYVRTVYALALLSFKGGAGILPKSFETDPPGLLSFPVLDKLSIDVNEEVIPYSAIDVFDKSGNSDFRFFKSRPLLRLSNGDYVIYNPKLLIDRLYSSLYFDFIESSESIEGKSHNISSIFTESFVEKTMLSRYMKECLSPDIYSSYDENHLKELYRIHDGEPGYPDYYLRNSITNAVVLFECKDIRLNSYIKEQRDYDLIEEELRNKIVEKTYQLDAENKCRKKVGPRRIGIGQLAAHVANIKRGTFPWDTTLPPDCSVYPVLVIADNRLLFDGLPYLAQQWYQERLAIEGTIPKSSRPLIMMSPLTLLKYWPLFKENGFEFYFEEYYASLQSVSGDDIMGTINGMISFDSFMGQYPYSLEELREEIMTTLFTPDEQNVLR